MLKKSGIGRYLNKIMDYSEFQKLKKIPEIGTEMYDMMIKLYPICRSITGDGVRKTLDIISEQVPLEKHEILTGTEVFDWTIPKEWNIKAPNLILFQLQLLLSYSISMQIHSNLYLFIFQEYSMFVMLVLKIKV